MTITARELALEGIERENYYENGTLKDCILGKKNSIPTECGVLVPLYGEENVRRKYNKSVSFYPSGILKSVSLEEQTEVETPMGEFPAELLTFYESGKLKRVFPLNGKLSGYWSEDEEKGIAIPFGFEFDFAAFRAKIVGLHFYESGALKSLTLFPGEIITIESPMGEIPVRIGFSLYESGKLKTLEPAEPVLLMTDLGPLTAFDPAALGLHADDNSLGFYEDGALRKLATVSDQVGVTEESGRFHLLSPLQKLDPLDDDRKITLPLRISFEAEELIITDDKEHRFDGKTVRLNVFQRYSGLGQENQSCSPSDCASCSANCKQK